MLTGTFFNKILPALLSLCALNTILLSPAFAQSGGQHNLYMREWMVSHWGMMGWFGMVMMLLFWLLVISGVFFLIQKLIRNAGDTTNRSNKGTDSQAIDILKERYAKGEITHDEFESMKKEILR